MKHATTLFALALVFASVAPLFAQEIAQSPMYYWEYVKPLTLYGKTFRGSKYRNSGGPTYADSYREQDGYAIVQGRKLHYWLYDTLTYHDGDSSEIYSGVIPKWVTHMGYAIDYNNVYVSDPNLDLAESVRALMKERSCDISLALVTRENDYTNGNVDYVVINEYFSRADEYRTTIYYLSRISRSAGLWTVEL